MTILRRKENRRMSKIKLALDVVSDLKSLAESIETLYMLWNQMK